jgi:hypothetical protein
LARVARQPGETLSFWWRRHGDRVPRRGLAEGLTTRIPDEPDRSDRHGRQSDDGIIAQGGHGFQRHAAGALDDPRRLSDRRWRQARWSWRTLLYRRGRYWRIRRGGKIQEPPSIICVTRRRLRNRRDSAWRRRNLWRRARCGVWWRTHRIGRIASMPWRSAVKLNPLNPPRPMELRRLIHTNVWVLTTNARPTPTNVR